MKKILFSVILSLCFAQSQAQIPDGTTAADFTFKDINGTAHNLYSYLNAGKYVVLEIGTTWCSTCWTLHNGDQPLAKQYTAHELGDSVSKVLFLEADTLTTLSDLYGSTTNSKGNWVTNTNYTMLNPAGSDTFRNFELNYNIKSYPSFYVICPNKKIWQDTLNNINAPWPTQQTFEWIKANKCNLATGLDAFADAKPITLYPNPSNNSTTIYFSLQKENALEISLWNLQGQMIQQQNYGMLQAGDQKINYNTSNLANGVYFLKINAIGSRGLVQRLQVNH
jgi:hypothetical protein